MRRAAAKRSPRRISSSSPPSPANGVWLSDSDVLPQTVDQSRLFDSRLSRRKKRRRRQRYFVLLNHSIRAVLRKKRKVRCSMILAFLLVTAVCGVVIHRMIDKRTPSTTVDSNNKKVVKTAPRFSAGAFSQISLPRRVSFPIHSSVGSSFHYPHAFYREDFGFQDFGGLEIDMFEEENMTRAIYHEFKLDLGKNPKEKHHDDSYDRYYAFDDDRVRNPYLGFEDDEIKKKQCRRTSWHRDLPIDCNKLHEFDLSSFRQAGKLKYVGSGTYRDVFVADLGTENVVYKMSPFEDEEDWDYTTYEFIRVDNLVAERLSWSPQIVDIYGFCALGHIGEPMPNGDLEKKANVIGGRVKVHLDDAEHLDPQNDFTPSDKLRLALEMAEPLALLNGFPGGVIVHDDIQLSQYLFTPDGHLKLNDFNRAEIMLWNEEDQEYCRYRNNPGHGDWRAPEEYYDNPLNEKIDVWSLANNIYTVLTGLFPFYDDLDTHSVQKRVKKGETAYIDPRWRERSFAERKLVELIEKCWKYDPQKRIDMFSIVKFLREAVEENKRHHLHEDKEVYYPPRRPKKKKKKSITYDIKERKVENN